jgi:hypothetical protein
MRIFETYEEIEEFINQNGKKAIVEVGDFVLKEVQNFVQEKIYDKPESPYYQRTGDFKRSIKLDKLYKSSAREYGFKIYIDYNEIMKHPRDKYNVDGKYVWGWPKHESVFKDDVTKWIPLWMDLGHGGLAHGSAINFMQFLLQMFNNDNLIKTTLRKKFEYYGFDEFESKITAMGINFNFK